jgi:hypothetical protein
MSRLCLILSEGHTWDLERYMVSTIVVYNGSTGKEQAQGTLNFPSVPYQYAKWLHKEGISVPSLAMGIAARVPRMLMRCVWCAGSAWLQARCSSGRLPVEWCDRC